jgi:hypothetical protein
LEEKKMLEYAMDLITDLKYSMDNDEEQTIEERDIKTIEWLIEQAKRTEMYKTSLIQIAENKVSPVIYAQSTLYETEQRFN